MDTGTDVIIVDTGKGLPEQGAYVRARVSFSTNVYRVVRFRSETRKGLAPEGMTPRDEIRATVQYVSILKDFKGKIFECDVLAEPKKK